MVLSIALVLIALRLAAEIFLSLLNSREVRRHAGSPPPAVAAIMDAATGGRAADYTLAKGRLGRVELAWDALVLAALLLCGALPRVYAALCPADAAGAWFLWSRVFCLIGTGVALSFLSLPLDWWGQFRL
ncbi:MAG: M48 family peptidase, partial [Opitutaceae bacterium]|nr:M48 family peptidase [Opitutaceae bacterium]